MSQPGGSTTTTSISVKLGFAGLGIMGSGMAGSLLKARHDVKVYNRTRARTNPLADSGASVASSPRDLAADTDMIFVSVSDTTDVEQVLFGGGSLDPKESLAAGLRPGSLVIDHSTVSPAATRAWAVRLADEGIAFLDAPVSGGSEGAANGTLSIMVGGDAADVERARPYLESMGKTVTHTGPVGTGQLCKLANQVLVVVNMLGVSEALLLAQAGGLDPAVAVEATSGGAGGSWMLANRGPQVIDRDFRPGFTIDLQQKDLRLVLETADELGVPALATAMIHQLYRVLQNDGLGGEGNHALAKALEKLSGKTIGPAAKG
jgi:3-hydroxyisobutyrate dehydrogenase